MYIFAILIILFVQILLVFIFKLQKSRNEASVSANQLRDKLKDLKDKSDVLYNFNLNVLCQFYLNELYFKRLFLIVKVKTGIF